MRVLLEERKFQMNKTIATTLPPGGKNLFYQLATLKLLMRMFNDIEIYKALLWLSKL